MHVAAEILLNEQDVANVFSARIVVLKRAKEIALSRHSYIVDTRSMELALDFDAQNLVERYRSE